MQISLSLLVDYKGKKPKSLSDIDNEANDAWDWLTTKARSKKDAKNLARSQHKTNLEENRLRKPFERMSDIAPYFYRLRTEKLDKIFNAQTMRQLLTELLKDPKYEGKFVLRDDFKTIELGKMFTEIGLYLLKNSTTNKSVHENIDKVLDDYKRVSESKMYSETYAEHGNQKERALTKKQENNLLQEKSIIEEKKRKTNADKTRLDEIEKELGKKYDHFKPYYCEINPLNEFNNDVIRKYDIEFDELQTSLRIPAIPGIASGYVVPMQTVRYVRDEIRHETFSLGNDLKELKRKILEIQFMMQSTKKGKK